jgi:1-acyl-sn-glycerol-3-phosphate acyltransferase
MRWLASFIFQKLLGWKIEGAFAPDLKKCVIIVVPHTSWHDFYIGALVRKIIDIDINFIAKRELFRFPFGWYFKWMGGAPVDRKSNKNTVQQVTEMFNNRDEFRLALAPEGTRKKVEHWRSGFYHMAHNAGVPIVCVAFDYKTKVVKIGSPFKTSGNFTTDYPNLRKFYDSVVGKIPAYT